MSKSTERISKKKLSVYGLNLERMVLNKMLYEVHSSDIIAFLVNSYDNRLLPPIRKFLYIPNRINESVGCRQ
jgi:hypothetical protein